MQISRVKEWKVLLSKNPAFLSKVFLPFYDFFFREKFLRAEIKWFRNFRGAVMEFIVDKGSKFAASVLATWDSLWSVKKILKIIRTKRAFFFTRNPTNSILNSLVKFELLSIDSHVIKSNDRVPNFDAILSKNEESEQMRPRSTCVPEVLEEYCCDLRYGYCENQCFWQPADEHRDRETVVCHSGRSACEYSMVCFPFLPIIKNIQTMNPNKRFNQLLTQ